MASQPPLLTESYSDIEDEPRREARNRAIERLSYELLHSDQLNKVEQIRSEYNNKKISLNTQLKYTVSSQLKAASEGMQKLCDSLVTLNNVRNSATTIQSLVRETVGLIPHYGTIQELNVVRNNLRITQEKLSVFIQIPLKLAKIRKLMKEEENILKAYVAIRSLENERDIVLNLALQFPTQHRDLCDILRSVDRISDDLDDMLWSILHNHFNLALTKPAILIRAIQIVYRESKLVVLADGPTTSRKLDYLSAATSRLHDSIRSRFFANFEDCKIKDDGCSNIGGATGLYVSASSLIGGFDAQKCVNASRIVLVDLEKAIDNVRQCFPDTFNIRELYIQSYHECFYELLAEISKVSGRRKDPVSDTLLLFKWINLFYEPQLKRLAISPKRIPLLADALAELVGEYREYVFNSIDELANQLIAMDGEYPPEIINEALYTVTPVTLFSIIQRHLEVAITANSPIVVSVTFGEIKKVLLSFQQKFRRCMEESYEAKSYEISYLVALINNFDRCYENTQDMDFRAISILDNVTYNELMMNEVMDGFQNLVKYGRELLVKQCFSVLEEDVMKLFTNAWYQEEIVEVIIATLNDYFRNDIKGNLLGAYFRKFCVECLDKIVLLYVTQLVYGKNHNKTPLNKRTAERLKYDASRLSSFFTTWQVRDKFVKNRLQILYDLSDLIESDFDHIPRVLDVIIGNSSPYINSHAIESLLRARADLNRKQVSHLIATFNALRAPSSPPPTQPLEISPP